MSGMVTSSLLPDPPRRAEEEFTLQKAVCQFLKWAVPADCVWHSIPNGGQRHTRAAQKLVATGLRAGVPDLLVIYRGRPTYIELKTPVGRLSADQRQMHQRLAAAGADVFVLRSVEGVESSLREIGIPLRGSVS